MLTTTALCSQHFLIASQSSIASSKAGFCHEDKDKNIPSTPMHKSPHCFPLHLQETPLQTLQAKLTKSNGKQEKYTPWISHDQTTHWRAIRFGRELQSSGPQQLKAQTPVANVEMVKGSEREACGHVRGL